MKIHRAAAAFLFSVLFSLSASAVPCSLAKEATLPVTYHLMVPTVPITINGEAINLGIDTGAQISVVTPETATKLQLPIDSGHYYSRISGTSGIYQTINATARSLMFAGVEYKRKRLNVIPMNPEHFSSLLETGLEGVAGADILTDYTIDYDVPAGTITFLPVEGCPQGKPAWKGKYVKLSISVTETNGIAIPIMVNGHKLTGIFDTGAGMSVITLAAAKRIGLTEEMLAKDRLFNTMGAGGNARKTPLHQFDSLVVAGEIFKSPKFRVVNFPSGEGDMLIGEDYMQGHRFRISYAGQALYVQNVTADTPK